jgi:hypothetical protein
VEETEVAKAVRVSLTRAACSEREAGGKRPDIDRWPHSLELPPLSIERS